jgi:hypothetical protein
MKAVLAIALALSADTALAQVLPVPKPGAPGGSRWIMPARIRIERSVLRAIGARAGCGSETAGRHMPVGLDIERQLLLAQRPHPIRTRFRLSRPLSSAKQTTITQGEPFRL